MKNEQLGKVFRQARKNAGLKVPEVSKILKEKYGKNTAVKTIYGWECDAAYPALDLFLIICKIYGITDLSPFFPEDYEPDNLQLTPKEKEIIKAYRQSEFQDAIQQLLGTTENE